MHSYNRQVTIDKLQSTSLYKPPKMSLQDFIGILIKRHRNDHPRVCGTRCVCTGICVLLLYASTIRSRGHIVVCPARSNPRYPLPIPTPDTNSRLEPLITTPDSNFRLQLPTPTPTPDSNSNSRLQLQLPTPTPNSDSRLQLPVPFDGSIVFNDCC